MPEDSGGKTNISIGANYGQVGIGDHNTLIGQEGSESSSTRNLDHLRKLADDLMSKVEAAPTSSARMNVSMGANYGQVAIGNNNTVIQAGADADKGRPDSTPTEEPDKGSFTAEDREKIRGLIGSLQTVMSSADQEGAPSEAAAEPAQTGHEKENRVKSWFNENLKNFLPFLENEVVGPFVAEFVKGAAGGVLKGFGWPI